MSTSSPVAAGYLTSIAAADLGQRGRSGMQVLGSIQVAAYHLLRTAARQRFDDSEAGIALARDHQAGGDAKTVLGRVKAATALAESDPVFRLERFLQRYVAEENWNRGIVAVEEQRDRFSSFLHPAPAEDCGSLALDPEVEVPAFHGKVDFHLQPGGWEGYDLYGPVLSHAVYPHVFARGGFAAMPATKAGPGYRARLMDMLPKTSYARIYDIGCGSGSTTRWINQRFPEAELVACDLSAVQLKAGYDISSRAGAPIHFKQRDARDTREPSASFDLVVHNAVAHEMPLKANLEVFREIFRILKPGGDLLMMDPPPLRSVDPFQAVLLNWETRHREEPFFSGALLADWEAELAAIGFTDIHATVMEDAFPWVLIATKPAA